MLTNTIAMLAGTNTASERLSKFVKPDALDVQAAYNPTSTIAVGSVINPIETITSRSGSGRPAAQGLLYIITYPAGGSSPVCAVIRP